MARLRHPNVVSFMAICVDPPCIVTEYCSRRSLYDVLRSAARAEETAGGAGAAGELGWRRRLAMVGAGRRGAGSGRPPALRCAEIGCSGSKATLLLRSNSVALLPPSRQQCGSEDATWCLPCPSAAACGCRHRHAISAHAHAAHSAQRPQVTKPAG